MAQQQITFEAWRRANCGSARKAGRCAIDANPRLALAPTIPTRILLLFAITPSRERQSVLSLRHARLSQPRSGEANGSDCFRDRIA